MVNQTMSRLTLITEVEKNKWGQIQCLYKCTCGNEKKILRYHVASGATKSCGCLNRERNPNVYKTHGMRRTRFYNIWSVMRGRCKRQKSSYLGIHVCDRWVSFECFKEDMLPKYQEHCDTHGVSNTTIDRISTKGDYTPNNCRWATYKGQCRNRTCTLKYEYNGDIKTIQEWADLRMFKYRLLYKRLRILNWSVDKALTTPVDNKSKLT